VQSRVVGLGMSTRPPNKSLTRLQAMATNFQPACLSFHGNVLTPLVTCHIIDKYLFGILGT
jgi:hypothetical protein